MIAALTVLGWVAVGLVAGALLSRRFYQNGVIAAGRGSRAPVCNSCPFVNDEQRAEIRNGRPGEAPPLCLLPLPLLPVDPAAATPMPAARASARPAV